MGYKDNVLQEDFPDHGAIFMSNIGTKKECFRRKLFGFPSGMAKFVKQVKKGTTLFLFEYERRELYGVFRATCDGGVNIVANAFEGSGKQFPAQVRFSVIWNCRPLTEHEFGVAISDNYISAKKFKFGLTEHQVDSLMKIFHTKRIPKIEPERHFSWTFRRPAKHNRRSGGDRNRGCDRVEYVTHEEGNTVKIERAREHYEERPSMNDVAESGSFDNRGRRQGILEEDINQSGLRRFSDVPPFFTGDIYDERHMDVNVYEERGLRNQGGFSMMKKIKSEQEPYGMCVPEVGQMDCDGMPSEQIIPKREPFVYMENIVPKRETAGHVGWDECDRELWENRAPWSSRVSMLNREHDEFPVVSGSRRCVSTGGRFSGCEIVESERRTLPQHPLGMRRGENDGGMFTLRNIEYEHDVADSRFRKREIMEGGFKERLSYSDGRHNFEAEDCYQSEQLQRYPQFYNTGRSYGTGLPYSRSYDDKVSKTVCDQESFDFHHSRMSEPLPYQLQNKTSVRDSCDKAGNTNAIEGYPQEHGVLQTDVQEGPRDASSLEPTFPYPTAVDTDEKSGKVPELNASSSFLNSFACYDSLHRSNRTKKRPSVFSRLGNEKLDFEKSVDEVMEWAEGSLNSLVRKTGKRKIATRQEEDKHEDAIKADKIVEYEQSKVEMKPEGLDSACKGLDGAIAVPQQTGLVDSKGHPDGECGGSEHETAEMKPENTRQVFGDGVSILQETRLVDFKRRKKVNMIRDGKCKENSTGMVESKQPAELTATDEELAKTKVSDGIVEVKRRKLHRPVFVKPESIDPLQPTHEDAPKSSRPIEQAAAKSVQGNSGPSASNQDGANAIVAEPSLEGQEQANQLVIFQPSSRNEEKSCGWIEY